MYALAALYIAHWVFAFQIAPDRKLTRENMLAGVVIASMFSCALVWSGIRAARGGRLVWATMATVLCLLGSIVSFAFSLKLNPPRPYFSGLQIVIALVAISSLVVLCKVEMERSGK